MKNNAAFIKKLLAIVLVASSAIKTTNAQVTLNLKLFIEGYYIGNNTMQPALFNVGLSENSEDMDSITVELLTDYSPETVVDSRKIMLHIDGTATISYPSNITGGRYYISVHHRNSLRTISQSPIIFSSALMNYDFTTSNLQVHGENEKEIESGVWAFYGGDINQDGSVDSIDGQILNNEITSGSFGYNNSDLNGDGFVDANDFLVLDPNLVMGVKTIIPVGFCGTPPIIPNGLEGVTPNGFQNPEDGYCINICIHVIKKSDGSGGQTSQEIQTALDILRNDYKPYNINFVLLCQDEIHSDLYYNYNSILIFDCSTNPNILETDCNGDGKFDVFSPNANSNAVDIYLFANDKLNFGLASNIPGTALVIGGSAFNTNLASSHILSHEMGHCLGLYHTFHGSACEPLSCPELVNGSNSASCGDFVGDTPADPKKFSVDQNTCTWNGGGRCGGASTDANNNLYSPNEHLFMAYVPPQCMSYHTSGQVARMFNSIANYSPLQSTLTSCCSVAGDDYWMRDKGLPDSPVDNGIESNPDNGPMWISRDIWVRNESIFPNDLTNSTHANPEFVDCSKAAFVYVRVRRGCQPGEVISDDDDRLLNVHWAKAATSLAWPGNWDGSKHFDNCTNCNISCPMPIVAPPVKGNIIGNLPLTGINYTLNGIPGTTTSNGSSIFLPQMLPGDVAIFEFPWIPPNPNDYAGLTTEDWHFCLVARLQTPTLPPDFYQYGLHTPESSDINGNVKNNNNIIWRNISIITGHHKKSGLVRNDFNAGKKYNLLFQVPTNELANPIVNHGTIIVELGQSIYQKWIAGGSLGSGIVVNPSQSYSLLITSSDAKIENLLFGPEEESMLHISVSYSVMNNDNDDHTYNFDIIQQDYDNNSIIGGLRFELHKPAICLSPDAGTDITICHGDSGMLSATPLIPLATYEWYDQSGQLIDTGALIFVSPAQTSIYKLKMSSPNGCIDFDSVKVTVLNFDDNNVCTTDACDPITGIITHTQVNIDDDNPCTYDGCTEPTGVFHNLNQVIVSAVPSAAIQCFGYATCVAVSATGGSGVYASGTGNFCGYGAGDYTFTVTDSSGCSGTSANVHLSEPDKIEGTTLTASSTCGNLNGSISVVPAGGDGNYVNYLWNSSPVQTTQSATGLLAGTYTVTITDDNGCTGTASGTIGNLGSLPAQPSIIAGPSAACKGQTGVLFSIVNVPGVTYNWSLPIGASGSSTSNSISVNFSLAYAGGLICVSASNTCGTSSQSCKPVQVITGRPAFPATPSGPSINVCGPTTVSYSILPSANATSYQWTVTGAGFTLLSGQGTTSITVNVTAGFSIGQVRVYSASCSGISGENSIQVYGVITSQPQQAIFPNIGICGGNTYVYAVTPFNGATSITWTAPAGSLINGLPTPQSLAGNSFNVNITFPLGFISGNVSVFGSNGCGNGPARNVLVRSVPAQPAFISGPTSVACGAPVITYSTTGSPGATSYIWILPSGVTGSSTTNTITVGFTGGFSGSGNICVIPVNACGNGTQRCLAVTCSGSTPLQQNTFVTRTSNVTASEMNAYPNPTAGKMNVSFNSLVKEKYTLKVTDLVGKVMVSRIGTTQEGMNIQEIDLSKVAKGMYLISIEREVGKIQTITITVE